MHLNKSDLNKNIAENNRMTGNDYLKSIAYSYNKKTENKDLIKLGFVNSKNINPIYDEAKIQIGVLVSEKNGKLLFIEKLAFQQPY